jgi:hypothetical protein
MSGPTTLVALRGKPCAGCGSARSIRWGYDGHVHCVDLDACLRRRIRAVEVYRAGMSVGAEFGTIEHYRAQTKSPVGSAPTGARSNPTKDHKKESHNDDGT